ncbi:hypothetical protein [Enterococcus faecium]|uniref:hypothetical protein n=1 Tax=Enterococcus faecium TaxID=1352 RepID=UPI0021587E96|nr:hypothetical protein [Enterococcus faecium]
MKGKIKKILKIFLALIVMSICLFFSIKRAEAEESGILRMNNQVIYEDSNQKKNSETNFVIPDLFLTKKTELEKKINMKKEVIVKNAKNDVFKTERHTQEVDFEKKVRSYLFTEPSTIAVSESIKTNENLQKSSIKFWFYVGIFLGGALLLLLGVSLGNRFSYHRVRKES